ncbi:MAG: nuclear transport factor 2 family protein [Actinomycetota bacterium]
MTKRWTDVVRERYAAFNRGDWDTAFRVFDDSFEVHDHTLPDAPVFRGRDAMRKNLAEMTDAFEDMSYEPDRVLELGDRVLVQVRASGRGKESGIEVGGIVGHLWTVKESRILRLDIYQGWTEALEAVGRRE